MDDTLTRFLHLLNPHCLTVSITMNTTQMFEAIVATVLLQVS